MTLTLTPLPHIPLVQPGDDLSELIWRALIESQIVLQDGDVVVVAQKVVSKAEGRLVHLTEVSPSARALELAAASGKDARLVELILSESREVLRVRPGTIIVEHRLGFVCANAGIDHSNVSPAPGGPSDENWLLLLPRNPDQSAEQIRTHLVRLSGAQIGVLIIDSHGRAWRLGTLGTSIGLAGMPGLIDLRGTPDLFGFRLRITQVGAADELAAAASLVMGQAAEGWPVVHARGFPYALREGSVQELFRPREEDLFR